MRIAVRAGMTRSQRRRRRRRVEAASATYWRPPPRVGKNPERTARRHPPTECSVCGVELTWVPELGGYRSLRETYEGAEERYCAHVPANGAR